MIGTVKKGKIKNFGIFVTENIHIVFKQDTFIGQCSRLVHTKNVHASKALHGVDIFDNRLLFRHGKAAFGQTGINNHWQHFRHQPNGNRQ